MLQDYADRRGAHFGKVQIRTCAIAGTAAGEQGDYAITTMPQTGRDAFVSS